MRLKLPKASAVCSVVLLALVLSGCGSSSEELVKKGTLPMDSSVTVGDALDGYRYFDEREWKSYEDPEKRRIVEFKGVFGYDRFADTEWEGMLLSSESVARAKQKLGDLKITYESRFAISRDGKSFELKYSGMKMSGTNRTTGKKVDKDIADENLQMVKNIYANKPELSTWGLLLSAGGI